MEFMSIVMGYINPLNYFSSAEANIILTTFGKFG
jgi:hypothetical protein